MNRELAVVQAERDEAAKTWARYLKVWTVWNYVRSLASVMACALFLPALQGV
ncbi:hypothetical protein ACFOW6_00995 [Fodinicurvata halophila]|uniref:Uncharacterized protein n=1 Tax=Fodinicurvata halophila TaxID=1419723 RepID=A0ABV8UFR3_9PROT